MALLCVAVAVAVAEPIVVKSVRRSAEIKKASSVNHWRALKKGTPVKPGDTVRTGQEARVELKIEDGSRVVLGSKSRIQVAISAPSRIFSLSVGRVKAFVKKIQPTSKFEIRTPLAAAAVRGTVFEMGYDEKEAEGFLQVDRGVVVLSQADQSVDVRAGERLAFIKDKPLGEVPGRSVRAAGPGATDAARSSLRREVALGMSKENVMLAAAEEIRNAEYREGKVMTDLNGHRVRLEEYVIRNPTDLLAQSAPDRAFKLVVLNERESRFDYFYYLEIFNKTLPSDLSVALREIRGKLTESPEYFLSAYERGQSNTIDAVLETASGGHLVQVTFDGTNYTLSSVEDPSDTRVIAADEPFAGDDGVFHKVYDPVADRFVTLGDEEFLAGEGQPAAYDSGRDVYRPLEVGESYWRTAFDAYDRTLMGPGYSHLKQSYRPSDGVATILALDSDATLTSGAASNGQTPWMAVTESPSGADVLHERLRLFYADGTLETVNTYILSDEGKIAGGDTFAGLSTGAAFKNELMKWNYQQVTEASEFNGRKIDLVLEPRILIRSGLLP